MTTSSPVPPLVEHTGGNSYHLRRKSILRKSKVGEREGWEGERGGRRGEAEGEEEGRGRDNIRPAQAVGV